MRTPLLLASSCLAVLASCATTATPEDLPAPEPSLADELPADTLVYFEIPDVQGMRARMQHSPLGKMYHDPEMQEFIGPMVDLLSEGWVGIRSMAAGMQIPEEAVSWDTLHSIEAGLALRAVEGLENPFEEEPEIYALARVRVAEGLAQPLFNVCVNMLGGQMDVERVMTDTGEIASMEEDDFVLELSVDGETDELRVEFTMGGRGEGRLSDTREYRLAQYRLDREGGVVFGYLDYTSVMETIVEGLSHEVPQFAAPISRLYDRALAPMESMSFTSGWSDDGAFTSGMIHLGADADEDLWDLDAADLSLLEYVPHDATAFQVADASAAGAWLDLLMTTFDDFASVEIEDGMTMKDMVAQEGGDMYDWLWGEKRNELDAALDAMGSRSFGYGRTAGFAQTTVSFLELEDGEALSAVFEQVMPRMREALQMAGAPVALDAKRLARRVEGETVAGPAYYSLNMGDMFPSELAMMGLSFQPTFAVTDDGWLVFSIGKQPVREALRDGLVKPERNILENEDVQVFLADLDDDAYSVGWSDPRPALRAAVGMALGMAPMAAPALEETGLPIDLEKLPSADLFVRYMRPMESVGRRVGDDVLIDVEGSFGIADLFTISGAAVSLAPMIMMAQGAMPGPQPQGEGLEEF